MLRIKESMDFKTRVGPKGQVVIPKPFREEFRILPGDTVFVKDTPEGILLRKQGKDPAEVFRGISEQVKRKRIAIDPHEYERESEERWKRSST